MAPRPRKRASSTARGRGSGSGWRALLAIALLVGGVSAVVVLSRHQRREPEPVPAAEQPIRVVREVASRHGCPAEAVSAEEQEEPGGSLVVVTVHAGRAFPVERFSLDLQAAVHNLGGRLAPKPLAERGGYGLARLEGRVGDTRWRVVVLGEPPRPSPRTVGARRSPAAPALLPAGEVRGRLAVVLDDAGHNLEVCEQARALPSDVAFAVLPNTPHATAVAECLAAQRRELLLHLPMQPIEEVGDGPGPDAIEVGLSSAEVRARLQRALGRVPGVRGVNNHMGSLATADATTMEALAVALRPTGLYFLDSRTSADSVAGAVMREAGVPVLRRDVFLDVVDDPAAIRRMLAEAAELGEQQGQALAIGHVHPTTLKLLAAELPRLAARLALVRPSALAAGK
ncbi:MAG TPA: divergent polysaccharide deacetylase family protein [Thermoanaerobaculaceae bacterium]|nr:divergent polysaccharide deacetylase family protein [Thermoanaerobaculaceae bacterium]HRS16326.1 divergent polysaccharide deacetylase family protein [Thermoanaerobaculaceae bacterium]